MKKLCVVLMAIALIGTWTAGAVAADWKFYGSARMTTFYDMTSEEASSTGYDSDNLTWDLQGNARIGAKVKVDDTIKGRFEYGAESSINLRLLYGEWNFGSGTLLVGQAYTPLCTFISAQAWGPDKGLLNYGVPYGARKPQIALKFGGLNIGLISANTKGQSGGPEEATVETTLPKIEASYKFSTNGFWMKPYVGYNSFDVLDADDNSSSIDSYVAGAFFGLHMGPFNFKADGFYGSNSSAYGFSSPSSLAGPMWVEAENDFKDAIDWGGAAIVDHKVSDKLGFQGGFGYRDYEQERGAGVTAEQTVMTYYVNCTIKIAKDFFIRPEIGMVDYGDLKVTGLADEDLGNNTYIGAKWQIDF